MHDHGHDTGPRHGHDHDHPHDHGAHHHGVGHSHAPAHFGRAFAIGTGLNVAMVVLEAIFGILSGSVALLADAGHNLGDVLGLVVAWVAYALAARPPSPRYTFGWGRASILAALFNALVTIAAAVVIAWEAAERLAHPAPLNGMIVVVIAAIGLVINGGTAWLFASGLERDLNIRGAFLHMAADAGISAGVVVSGLLIMFTGWQWLDPAVSLLICVAILWPSWGLLRDSVRLALDGVPPEIRASEVRRRLQTLPGVADIHALRIWAVSTRETAMTCHLLMPAGHPGDAFISRVARELHRDFAIGQTTLQIETEPTTDCGGRGDPA